MNQPKYKPGDTVRVIHNGNVFEVEFVYWTPKRISYSGGNYLSVDEENLELYQEPQKKKLYAYKFRNEIGTKVEFYVEPLDGKIYTPLPKYDIEYPTKEET